ncbi:MAG: selenide, water dikinase SelD [Rhodospirillaceae bacterium]|nr:selenide, water dikinase SelD [Rhodospirillaceae bacterium]MBT7363222.1 selenide, water dikinase SelD [Rhodospirillaceae bacterium]
MTPTVPITCDIVLVGGGHSHVAVLRRFGMKPEPGVRLTLITRDLLTPYSGMIPGYIADHYSEAEAHIDLRPLAAFANARVIHAAATGLDLAQNFVQVAGRPPVAFDLISIDTGSTPSTAHIEGAEHGLPVKPIDRFLDAYHRLTDEIRGHDGPFHITVAGGGAGGVELSLALSHRLRVAAPGLNKRPDDMHFAIVEAADTLLPGYNAAARRKLARALSDRGIDVRTGARVERVTPDSVTLSNGDSLTSDKTILVTSAGPPLWLADNDIARDERGFIRVDDKLRSPSHAQLFAAGDAASMDGHQLPKAGVYAVRQGPYLADNLRRAALDKPLKAYRPQGQALALITTGDRYAIAARGPFAFEGDWVWRWKDWIDRRWMKKYQELPEMDGGHGADGDDALEAMRCGGCGAKVPAPVLRRALDRLPPQHADGLDQGLDSPDDAAVLSPPPGKALIQTVDQFRAFIDDPYLFGRIAANHCLGDIFAMGADAHSALAAVMLPHGEDDKTSDDLYQLLAGATETLAEAGAVLAGGHTGEGSEMAFGLTVNGYAERDEILRKSGLQAGDILILTKPLGTGVLFAADMRTKANGDHVTRAFASMQRSLAPCIPVIRRHGATAGTDVTGFGLAGHMLEMLNASDVDAELKLDALPVLPGVAELVALGHESTLRPSNEESVGNAVPLSAHPSFPLLFDPQTAGGLLFGVPADQAEACCAELRAGPAPDARIIGRITPRRGSVGVVRFTDETKS